MRAGPLSNKTVSDTLNQYFVPVYTSNEDYRDDGPASPEERAAYQKIYRAALDAKLSTGTVHAYVLSPDGTPVDSLHVAEAARGDNTLQMLRRTVDRFATKSGEALVKPKAQSVAPASFGGAMVLHLTARAEGTNPSDNSWHAYPSENWIVLGKSDQSNLLPPAGAAVGKTWEIDRETATRILTHFYPQTENNDVRKNKIERAGLKATMLSVKNGVAMVRLDGDLRMRHPFYHKDTPDMVDAVVLGYMEFDPAARRVVNLKLATDRAAYRDRPFDVGVESVR
jgi:hypothetical protein